MATAVTPSRILKLPAGDRPVIQSAEWELQAIHQVTNPTVASEHWIAVTVSADVDPGTYGLVRGRCVETGATTGMAVVHSALDSLLLGWLARAPLSVTTIHVEAIRTLSQSPGGGIRVPRSAVIGADVFPFDPEAVAYPVGYDPTDPPPWPAVGSGTGGVWEDPATFPGPLPPPAPFDPAGAVSVAGTAYATLAGLDPATTGQPAVARADLLLRPRDENPPTVIRPYPSTYLTSDPYG